MQVKVKLSTAEATTIIRNTFAGCQYWARPIVSHKQPTAMFVEVHNEDPHEQSKCLDSVDECGPDTCVTYKVCKRDLERGLGLAIERGVACVTGALTTGRGVEYLDASACEIVVQLAIFGEVRYG